MPKYNAVEHWAKIEVRLLLQGALWGVPVVCRLP